MLLLIVLGIFLVALRRTDTTANITVAPSSVSAPLHTSANFTCEGTGDVLEWTVGGNLLTDPSNQDRMITVTTNNTSVDVWSSVLTIRALSINDRISIQCTVISFNPNGFKQMGATLTVKDALPVENLHFTFNFISSSRLTWSYPFENYPLSYHIYIENQHGQLLYNDITNDTSYALYKLTVCDIYTATVIAHSAHGQYSSSNVTIQDQYTEKYVAVLPDHKIIFNEHNSFNADFSVTVSGYPRLCNSTLLGIMNGTEKEYIRKDIVCSSEDEKSVTVNYTVENIGPQLNCFFSVDILDHFNKSKTKNESNFTTYHVQALTLQYYSDNGSVVVECIFAERSTADGCHVIFRESSKGIEKSINISKSSIEESTVYQYITLPVSGNYTVTAHDILDGTIITNPSFVYHQVLKYILPQLFPNPITIITTSSKETASLIIDNTSTINIMTSVKPTSGISSVPGSLYFTLGIVAVVVLIVMIISVIVFSCFIVQRRRRKQSITLNEERAVVHYPQARHNNFEDIQQLTTTISVVTDPYHISHNEILDIRRQHEQKTTPTQVQPPPSQPLSPPVVPHQASTTTPESSLINTVTAQAKTSVASEMNCVNEHDPLLIDIKDRPLTIPCDTVFEESLLVTMKSCDNGGATIDQDEDNDILLISDVHETTSTENTTEHDISHIHCKEMKGNDHSDDDSPFTKPITTHTGHNGNSGILISDDMTSYDERTTVSLGSNNKLSNTSKAEKNTSHYVEVEISATHPRALPTNDVPTQYVDICGHLNTMTPEDSTEVPCVIRKEDIVMYPTSELSLENKDHPPTYEELITLDNNNGAIIAQDDGIKSFLAINVSPQRPQGMNYVHNIYGHFNTETVEDSTEVSCVVNEEDVILYPRFELLSLENQDEVVYSGTKLRPSLTDQYEDNIPYIQETSLNENNREQNISLIEKENSCSDSSTHTKPKLSIHTGHHTDSGIAMSGGMTSAISKKGTSVSIIPESNNEHLNDALQGEKAPPTDNVPVQHTFICEPLNTMISGNRAGLGVGANVPEPTMVQDKEGKSQLMENVNSQRLQGMDCVVNFVQQRPQGMDYIDNTIVETFTDYVNPYPDTSSDNGTNTCLVNNILNTTSNEKSNETCGASNITSCQEGSVNLVENISELVFSNSSHYFDQKKPCTIEDEPDNVHQTIVDNSIPLEQ